MTRERYGGKAEGRRGSHVSRFGRAVKKPKQYETVFIRGSMPRYGKWTLRDKRKLLDCLKRNDCVYTNANFVYKSVGAKQRHLVDEYLKRLRKKAAHHTASMRKKQPPILTWFQVADELTWLKADEDLFEAIGTMLNIYSVEANSMQERNKTLRFGSLYKYINALQKDEKLPEITPAESVVLLDCFQHLADTLRICDCEAQSEFMRAQYQKYFSLLYETPGPKKVTGKQRNNSKEETDKGSNKFTVLQVTSQTTGQRPLMKAQLVKKTDKKKRKKKKVVKNGKSLTEEQGQSSSQRLVEDEEQRSPQPLNKSGKQVSGTVVGKDTGGKDVEVDKDFTIGEKETIEKKRLPSSGPDTQAESGFVESLDEKLTEDLDPDSPDFLARFANNFSLGSLNPFEIPTELLYLRKKERNSGELLTESLSSMPAGGTLCSVDSDRSIEGGDEISQEGEDLSEVDLTTKNSGS